MPASPISVRRPAAQDGRACSVSIPGGTLGPFKAKYSVILGFYYGSIGIMEKKVETT